LQETPPAELREALSGTGVQFDLGAARIALRSRSATLASQLRLVYRHFPFEAAAGWNDLHVRIEPASGPRRWVRPQVVFRCDGHAPFEPFPADSPLPLLEWGSNWLIGGRLNDLLLLHAGALERDGLALVLPATPGSGKSTLSAALSLSGWRLLSDEFGAFDPQRGEFRAMLKPVALKNASIEVIRRLSPMASIGPLFPKTRKGTVAHLAATPDAVQRRLTGAVPGAVIVPQWVADSTTELTPLSADRLFGALAFNAFNYTTLGEVGFASAAQLARRCPGWSLRYSDLGDAMAALDALWPDVKSHRLRDPGSFVIADASGRLPPP
jgi:hypothetical protein